MSKQQWGSVRKVRSVNEIVDLVQTIPSYGKIDREDLRRQLTERRRRTSGMYLSVTRKKSRYFRNFSTQDQYSELMKDRIAFAKGVGIWSVAATHISLTDYGRRLKMKLSELKEPYEHIAIFNLLFISKYKAYKKFLLRISELGGSVSIEGKFEKRAGNSRDFLERLGFLTDPASFHTIKDLFYDFGIVNWRKQDKTNDEKIYFTRELYRYRKNSVISKVVSSVRHRIPTSRIGIHEFTCEVLEVARILGLDNSQYYDILPIRDEICDRLQISDREFARLLLKASTYGTKTGRLIAVAVGPLISRPPMGYAPKVATLPTIFEDEPITKMMIQN
jgi:hypothetical protein